MQVILQEKIKNLGTIGDIVDVKPGYARNFLYRTGKALQQIRQTLIMSWQSEVNLKIESRAFSRCQKTRF